MNLRSWVAPSRHARHEEGDPHLRATAGLLILTIGWVTAGFAQQSALSALLQEDSTAVLLIPRPNIGTNSVTLLLAGFRDSLTQAAQVAFVVPDNQPTDQLDDFVFQAPLIRQTVRANPGWGPITGQLYVYTEDSLVAEHTVTISRPDVARTAVAVDQATHTLAHTKAWGGRIGPRFTLQVFDPAGNRPLRGLSASLVSVDSAGSGFDPKRQLHLTTDTAWTAGGAELWSLDLPADTTQSRRNLASGERRQVLGVFEDLGVGRYQLAFQLSAIDAKRDSVPTVRVNVAVRHSWMRAFAMLFLAVMISYVATKGLATRRKRQELRRRARSSSFPEIRGELAILPVVAVRARLSAVKQRLKRGRFLLPDTADLERELGRIEHAAALLRKVDAIKSRMSVTSYPDMVERRAEKRLREILAAFDPNALDATETTGIAQQLDSLAEWFTDAAVLEEQYWTHLQRDVWALLPSARPETFPKAGRPRVAELYAELEKAPPTTLTEKVRREESYARLKILFEHVNDEPDDFAELLEAEAKADNVDALFEYVDDIAWNQLARAAEDGTPGAVKLVLAQSGPVDRAETFQPLRFECVTEPPSLGNNYLFKHGLQYRWTVVVTPPPRVFVANPNPMKLEPRTEHPAVVQYAPVPGTVTAEVEIKYKAAPPIRRRYTDYELASAPGTDESGGPNQQRTVTITKSGAYRWSHGFTVAEVGALVIAMVIAIASGLLTLYAGNAVFGTLKDYLTLLVWGAGFEQGKNFVQAYAQVTTEETKGDT